MKIEELGYTGYHFFGFFVFFNLEIPLFVTCNTFTQFCHCLWQSSRWNCLLCQRKEKKKNRKIFKKEINISNRRKGKWQLRCVFELFVFHDLCIPGGKFRGLLREYENTCPKSCGQWLLNHNDEMFQSSEASDMFPVISGSRFCFGNRGFSL